MASGTATVFNEAKRKLINGTIDLDSNTLKACLTGSAQALSASFNGSSTDARYADLTAEVANGNGYVSGGVTLTGVSVSGETGTVTFTTNPASWSSATFTAKYIVIYSDSATNKDLICYMELESGSTVSPSNGTLTVNPSASGWFTLA